MNRWNSVRARVVGSPADADRILIGVCAVIWLVLLGTGVAAVVALINLGTGGHGEVTRSSHTPWALYIVAVVSALVILAAIPVLLRARQGAAPPPPVRRRVAGAPPVASGQAAGGSAITEKLRVFDPAASSPAERVWLRGSVLLAIAMGVALIAVAIATNLMAVGRDALSWGSYGVAALITVAMPVIPWLYLRQLHGLLARERNARR
ncbi:DUF2561 family protein [Mycolicibacillus koreensis]|nr:hypothetical protein MKOR_05270 [Mycolicibacillus koreensis]